ncbi:hypothetical protein ACLQ2P_07140 [Actinomadura citrea]|uniref:hypothetical protein n=1 Tax=Actinomadura citrea TaxID=46158 RepID=UPI003CE4F765
MSGASGDGAAFADPARVQIAAELAAALNVLRGGRTYAELDKAARALPGAGGGMARLPSSTVGDLVTKGRCERETLETFLAACEVPGADPDTLPAYVLRDINEQPATGLRPWLRTAARRGGMGVLVGGSSTGKTRCLLTAVQDVLPDWWLLHPRDATQLADQPPGRLVIWLDELQNYLDGADGLTAATAGRVGSPLTKPPHG